VESQAQAAACEEALHEPLKPRTAPWVVLVGHPLSLGCGQLLLPKVVFLALLDNLLDGVGAQGWCRPVEGQKDRLGDLAHNAIAIGREGGARCGYLKRQVVVEGRRTDFLGRVVRERQERDA